jgi:hypothetical protein
MDTLNLVKFYIDKSKSSMILEVNYWIVILIFIFLIILLLIWKKYSKGDFQMHDLELEISGTPKGKFKIKRNVENLYIANRIYLELITRKAAVMIDEENDVIYEVYNSWYKLFGILRKEIKNVPGHFLKSHNPTKDLIGLTVTILNEGIRPHLTEYQAKFRKWYESELLDENNKTFTPQQIQNKYPDYPNLIESMKNVNRLLIKYSQDLEKIIYK